MSGKKETKLPKYSELADNTEEALNVSRQAIREIRQVRSMISRLERAAGILTGAAGISISTGELTGGGAGLFNKSFIDELRREMPTIDDFLKSLRDSGEWTKYLAQTGKFTSIKDWLHSTDYKRLLDDFAKSKQEFVLEKFTDKIIKERVDKSVEETMRFPLSTRGFGQILFISSFIIQIADIVYGIIEARIAEERERNEQKLRAELRQEILDNVKERIGKRNDASDIRSVIP